MSDQKPLVLGVDHTCENCLFSLQVRPDPKVLQSHLVCKFFPPAVVAVATQRGTQISSIATVVADKEWCFQYRPRPAPPPAANADDIPTLTP